jgi:hypothetical protein
MKKKNWTTIIEFEVVKPINDIETKGEKIKLSPFGEYCPDNSLRGYQLGYLLLNPKNYRPTKIVVKGVEADIIYSK